MKQKKQFHPSSMALYAALVALAAVVITGLLQLTINLGMVTPPNPETYTLALQISAITVVILLALYAILEPDTVRTFMTGRQARYGSNAIVMILAFSGIIILANFLAYNNPIPLADLTEDKQNTLSPEMVSALQNLPGKMTATAFYSQQLPSDDARQLLDNMKSNSKGKFEFRFVDPDANPLEAKKYGVTGDGKIALEINGRKEVATYADESEILRAMDRLLNPEQRTVYFLTGHGERDINGSGDEAMSRARETLENKNFTVKTLNLLAEHVVPADAKAVIIAGPMQPLAPEEVNQLTVYTLRGGALVVMLDPIPLTDFGEASDPLAESLALRWGIHLRNDFIVDTASSNGSTAIGATYDPSHSITRGMNLLTVLPFARSIELTAAPEGVTQTTLVQTSQQSQSWGETDFSPLQGSSSSVGLDPEVDTPGPLILAAAAESDNGRVAVIGNSLFATDQGFEAYGNGDLFVNTVAWAAGQQGNIDITPRDSTQRTFIPPDNQFQSLAILIGTACLIPGLVLVAGIWAWASRRRRG